MNNIVVVYVTDGAENTSHQRRGFPVCKSAALLVPLINQVVEPSVFNELHRQEKLVLNFHDL